VRDKVKMIRRLLLAAVLAAGPGILFAGSSGARFLLLPAGARAESLGGAFFAIAEGVESVFHNPAGMADTGKTELFSSYSPRMMDTLYSSFACVLLRGKLGIGMTNFSAGTLEVNYPDGSTRTLNAGNDSAIGLACAFRLNRPGKSWNYAAGLGLKGIRSVLAEEYSAQSYAADLGFTAKIVRSEKFMYGVSAVLKNIGPAMKYYEEDNPLPSFAGAGYFFKMSFKDVKEGFNTSLLLTISCRDMLNEGIAATALGAEFTAYDILSVRFGIDSPAKNEYKYYLKYSCGVGLNMAVLRMDYSLSSQYSDYNPEQNLQNLSLTFAF
jgi:hypothetical protein